MTLAGREAERSSLGRAGVVGVAASRIDFWEAFGAWAALV